MRDYLSLIKLFWKSLILWGFVALLTLLMAKVWSHDATIDYLRAECNRGR